MNSTLPLFSVITSILCIFLLSIAITIMGLTIPKIVQQSKVRNGLIELRGYLLRLGWSVFALLLLTLAVLTSRFYIPSEWRVYAVGFMIIFFSLLSVIFSYCFYKIYTLNYSDISILYHDRVADLENKSKKSLKVKNRKKVN